MKGRLADGSFVAVKILSVDMESMRGEREFISELAALSSISHQNLVKLQGCCIDGANRFLVYEFMQNNSLAQTLLGRSDYKVYFSHYFAYSYYRIKKVYKSIFFGKAGVQVIVFGPRLC